VPEVDMYAVKIIRSPDQEIRDVGYKEYKLLKSIKHPNIIQMHGAYCNDAMETIYLVMDLVNG
jgi:serine/threonine protein kinase